MTFQRGQLVRVKNPVSQPTIATSEDHLGARRGSDAVGEVMGVTGDDGDLVWVRHGYGALAPYWHYELTLIAGPVQ